MKIYLQLYEAMEGLVHICRDVGWTIGPFDKYFNKNQAPCNYAACKGLELLVRHFASCKLSTNGGNFDYSNCKDRMKKQGKKDEMKWKILVRTKTIGGAPFFSRHLLAI
ncbi:hypothetical protein Pint_33032 [Pistacia integerrima]|uniref:Uncharacterized protein n=1 Tax=Pistacia integerrima TaxID=434235 RepID=A0ACC0X512_9ROSI|nr:hypothetical protein Pint_33032 [Pistacia integerrima]